MQMILLQQGSFQSGLTVFMSKMKKILYIDLDGVVVDLESHAKKRHGENVNVGAATSFDKKLFFNPPMMENALSSIAMLQTYYDIYFLSTAPWNNVHAWTDKRVWCATNLHKLAYKRLILSHRKDLMIGDYLIDDRTANGAGEFKGEHIHFGQKPFEDWHEVRKYLMQPEQYKQITNT